MGRGTLLVVRYGSGDALGGPERVGRTLRRSLMGRETLPELRDGWGTLRKVWDESGDAFGGAEQVGRPSGRSGTGQWILPVVRDGSADP